MPLSDSDIEPRPDAHDAPPARRVDRAMTAALCVFCLLTAFMLAGAIPSAEGDQTVIFRTPMFIAVAGTLAVLCCWCCVRRRRMWTRLGFQAAHLGVACIAVGAAVGHFGGTSTDFRALVGMGAYTDRLPTRTGDVIQLPFEVSVSDFDVQFYTPDYTLYREDEAGRRVVVGTFRPGKDGGLELGPHGTVPAARLRDEHGHLLERIGLEGGLVLEAGRGTPRHYEATLSFRTLQGPERAHELAVNHPVKVQGWFFYLFSYGTDEAGRTYVDLTARRDPGRPVVVAGIWMTIAGIAAICLRKRPGGA
jgi:hypothetical protein